MIRRIAAVVLFAAVASQTGMAQATGTKTKAAKPAADKSPTYEKDLPASFVAKAKVAEPTAAATAVAKVPGGKIRSVELDTVAGRLVYTYDIKVKGKSGSEEVNVDAMSGSVLAMQHEKKKQKLAEDSARAAKKGAAPAPAKKP
jgi:uncharacterized membrane protein YkoI